MIIVSGATLLMLAAGPVNSISNNYQCVYTAAAKNTTSPSVKSSNSEQPTLRECAAKIGQPALQSFVAACLNFFPAVFKSVGGTLFGINDSTARIEGIEVFK